MTARDERGNILKELGRLLGEYAKLGMKTLSTVHRFSPKLIELLAALGLIFVFLITCCLILCLKCGIIYWCSLLRGLWPRHQSRSQSPSRLGKAWGCCTGRTSPQPQAHQSSPHSPQSLPHPPTREGEVEGLL